MPSIREFEQWLTTGEAAERLNRSIPGVKWLLERRRLAGAKTHRGWLVDPKDVERFAREEEQRR